VGGVDRKDAGGGTPRGHRLHRLVRVKWLHVAIATVAARAQGVEVAETLMGFAKSGEITLKQRRGGTRRDPNSPDECHLW